MLSNAGKITLLLHILQAYKHIIFSNTKLRTLFCPYLYIQNDPQGWAFQCSYI